MLNECLVLFLKIFDENYEMIEYIKDNSLFKNLIIYYINDQNNDLQKNSLNIIGNLLGKDNEFCNYFIKMNGLDRIKDIFDMDFY